MPLFVRVFIFCAAALTISAPTLSCDEAEPEIVAEYDTIFSGVTYLPGLHYTDYNVLITEAHHFSTTEATTATIKISADVLTADPHDLMDFYILDAAQYAAFLQTDTIASSLFYTENVTHVFGHHIITDISGIGRYYIILSNKRDSTAKDVRATIQVQHYAYK